MASALGEKIRRLRKEKRLTLDALAEASGSSKSYIWELENSNDPPRPSAEKAQRIAAALGQTVEFLIDELGAVSEEDSADQAFYRQYRRMDPDTKAKIRGIIDVWGKDEVAEVLSPQRWAFTLTKLLNTFHAGEADRFPVNVHDLALRYSAQRFPDDPIARIDSESLAGFDGGLFKMPEGKKGWGIIYNNAISSPGRINFTLAHEFGHYLIHRHAYPDGIHCGQQDMVRWDSTYSKTEREANEFAAMLLMPLDDFRRQIEPRAKPSLDDLGGCAARYGVSLIAATLQWLTYTDRRSVLVVSRDGFILWARSSTAAFKTGAYFRTANKSAVAIPPASLAAAPPLLNDVTPVAHPSGVWLNEPCEESVLASDRYDFVVSLLHFGDPPPWSRQEPDDDSPDVLDVMSRNQRPR